ncbi:hypothetical protein D3C85_1803090 [compost metagenome]
MTRDWIDQCSHKYNVEQIDPEVNPLSYSSRYDRDDRNREGRLKQPVRINGDGEFKMRQVTMKQKSTGADSPPHIFTIH